MNRSVGFIGGGRITRIILEAFHRKGFSPSRIVVSDINPEAVTSLKNQFPGVMEGLPSEAVKQDILFIALHPPAIVPVLEDVKDSVSPFTLVISLAPKITIHRISGILKGHPHVARLIPNATSVINEGFNPVVFSKGCKDKEETMSLLRLMGETFETDEGKLEAYAIISAMLPTYFWFQWEHCIDIGVEMGLTREESGRAVALTLEKGLRTLFKSGMSPAQVSDLIPVKPIGAYEEQIRDIFSTNLLSWYQKIVP